METTFFSKKNIRLVIISAAILVAGYILLAQGPVFNPVSWTIAPIILVGVYCVLLPLSILVKGKSEKNKDNKGV